jgi:hypothetical protein
MRHAARTDKNQAEIVAALERAGISVEIIGKPLDLLICVRGETQLMEVKNPDRTSEDPDSRLTKAQVEFIAKWPGKVSIVRTPEEAIKAAIGEEALR